jgi:hypothetical protein
MKIKKNCIKEKKKYIRVISASVSLKTTFFVLEMKFGM